MKETKEEIATNFDINELAAKKLKLRRVHLPITKEREIARLYKEGTHSANQLSVLYGISENYVYNILDKFNIPRHYPSRSVAASINNWKRVNKLKREAEKAEEVAFQPIGPQIEMRLPKSEPKLEPKLEPTVELPPPPAAPKRKRTVKPKAKPKKSWVSNLFSKVFSRK